MSYEYKEEILLDIGPEPNCNYESESNRYYDKIDELDNVYTQAAKADEYEPKAKAWDRTQDLIKDCTGQFDASGEWDTDWCAFGNGIDEIIDEYESGEYDA